MVGWCYICKMQTGKRNDVSVHRIPRNGKIKERWFAFIGHKTGLNGGICSKHFKQSDFIYKLYGDTVRRFLKPGSCPSVLPRPQNTKKDVKLAKNNNNCISSITESDTNLETGITIKKEIQKGIIIDENVINTENSMNIQLKRETDDPLTIMKDNTNLVTSIILGNVVQESISVDETVINMNPIDIQLKRETDDSLAIIEHNTNLEASILLGDERQESINIEKRMISWSLGNAFTIQDTLAIYVEKILLQMNLGVCSKIIQKKQK